MCKNVFLKGTARVGWAGRCKSSGKLTSEENISSHVFIAMSSSASSTQPLSISETSSRVLAGLASLNEDESVAELCDVEFIVGPEGHTQKFLGMGNIMALVSPVFRWVPDRHTSTIQSLHTKQNQRKMLYGSMVESQYTTEDETGEGISEKVGIPRKRIRIIDIPPEAFEMILRSIALKSVTLPKSQALVASILYACEKYMMDSLSNDYVAAIVDLFNKHPSNALKRPDLFPSLRKLGLEKICKAILSQFQAEGNVVILCYLFPNLPIEEALNVLKFFPSISEEFIWKLCVKWAKLRKEETNQRVEEKKTEDKEEPSATSTTSTSTNHKRKKPENNDGSLPPRKTQRVGSKTKKEHFGSLPPPPLYSAQPNNSN